MHRTVTRVARSRREAHRAGRGAWLLALALSSIPALAQVPVLPPGTTYKPGFPLTIPNAGSIRAGHPAVADLGLTPGHKSIVFGTSGHKLYVVLYNGQVAPGFPVTLPSEITSSPAIGDVDKDGKPDIVVGYGSTFEGPTAPGGLRAYRNDGTLLWSKTTGDFDNNGVPDAVINSAAIADVDGDGATEVAFGASDGYVYLVRGVDGVNKPGWPNFARDNVAAAPALHDIDGDGKLDVIIGIDAHDPGVGGYLEVFRADGTRVVGFPKGIDQIIASSPAVGDIDGDGRPEIVFGTGTVYPNRAHVVYALHCDGTSVAGWPVAVDGQVFTSPALADLDGDGIPEVIVTDDSSGAPPNDKPHVYAFKGNGTRLFKTVPKAFAGVSFNAGDPIAGDFLGDGQVEILVPTNTEVCVLDRTGKQLTDDGTHLPGSYSLWTENALAGCVLDDFEPATAGVELVAVSSVPDATPTSSIRVHVWQRNQSGPRPWGAYRQNAARTGTLPGTPSCPFTGPGGFGFYTLTPCRVFDTRDPVGPYGGPALPGASQRTWTLTGRCGIPADARAVSANLTVVGSTTAGDLRIFAAGEGAVPQASSINYETGQVRANNVLVQLGSTGAVTVLSDQPFGTTHVLLDVSGYFR